MADADAALAGASSRSSSARSPAPARPTRCSPPRGACARRGRDVVLGVIDMHGKPRGEAAASPASSGVGTAPHGELDLDAVLRAPPAGGADRRPRARQPAGLAPSEALERRRRAARRRHRRVHDDERAAPGEPERRRGRDHRHARARDGSRHLLRLRRRDGDGGHVGRRAAGAPARRARCRWRTCEQGRRERFFSKGSLLALREIALRRVADVVEDEVQRYRADQAHRGHLEDPRPPALLHRARTRAPSTWCAAPRAWRASSTRSGPRSTWRRRSCSACPPRSAARILQVVSLAAGAGRQHRDPHRQRRVRGDRRVRARPEHLDRRRGPPRAAALALDAHA